MKTVTFKEYDVLKQSNLTFTSFFDQTSKFPVLQMPKNENENINNRNPENLFKTRILEENFKEKTKKGCKKKLHIIQNLVCRASDLKINNFRTEKSQSREKSFRISSLSREKAKKVFCWKQNLDKIFAEVKSRKLSIQKIGTGIRETPKDGPFKISFSKCASSRPSTRLKLQKMSILKTEGTVAPRTRIKLSDISKSLMISKLPKNSTLILSSNNEETNYRFEMIPQNAPVVVSYDKNRTIKPTSSIPKKQKMTSEYFSKMKIPTFCLLGQNKMPKIFKKLRFKNEIKDFRQTEEKSRSFEILNVKNQSFLDSNLDKKKKKKEFTAENPKKLGISIQKSNNGSFLHPTKNQNLRKSTFKFDNFNFKENCQLSTPVQKRNTALLNFIGTQICRKRPRNNKLSFSSVGKLNEPKMPHKKTQIDLKEKKSHSKLSQNSLLPIKEGEKESITSSRVLSERNKKKTQEELIINQHFDYLNLMLEEIDKNRHLVLQLDHKIPVKIKSVLFSWIFELCSELGVSRHSVHLTIHNLNKLLNSKNHKSDNLQFDVLTVLSLVSKMEEVNFLTLEQLIKSMDDSFSKEDLEKNEFLIFEKLDFCIESTSLFGVLLALERIWDLWIRISGFTGDLDEVSFHVPEKNSYFNFRMAVNLLERFLIFGVGVISIGRLCYLIFAATFGRFIEAEKKTDLFKYLRVFVNRFLRNKSKLNVFEDEEFEAAFFEKVDFKFETSPVENCNTYHEYLAIQTFNPLF